MRRKVPALLATGLVTGGCSTGIERTITITSEPPGALVHLNETEIGRTPVTTEFRFFGVYDVRLSREGYEPLATAKETHVPIWEYPVIDLLAILAPWQVKTAIKWDFELEPEPEPGTAAAIEAEQDLLERAKSLRDASRGG
ncbi:MAG: PEGA domain-containing protein [Planctomycetota bacterium]